MDTPEALMLSDLRAQYQAVDAQPAFTRLYGDDESLDLMYAYFHQQLNSHFDFMNAKAQANNHFNAEDSRQLIDLIQDIDDAREVLKVNGSGFEIEESYANAIELCRSFLVPSGGSAIPDDFDLVRLIKYEPVFKSERRQYRQTPLPARYDLKMIGSGAYANVYRYHDPEYDIPIALKRAKRGTSDRELARFRREFEILRELRHPNVLEVYRFNEERSEYTMEYCDQTLRDFIRKENAQLAFGTRRRVALQFVYGLHYLHSKGVLHRDISYQNALVKRFDRHIVTVKLSDFGMHKHPDSELTRTESELRGTILDPTLRSFKHYAIPNEVYAIGFVLSFIFSGRDHIDSCTGDVLAIIRRCVDHDPGARYADVLNVIKDIEALESAG